MGARTLLAVGALGRWGAGALGRWGAGALGRWRCGLPLAPLSASGRGRRRELPAASCNNPDAISLYLISVWLMLAGGLIDPGARLL